VSTPLIAKVEHIVVHHSAGNPADTIEDIDRVHADRGFAWSHGGKSGHCGYHRVYRTDGIVEHGRPLETMGAHAGPKPGGPDGALYPGVNKTSWGVIFVGNFSKQSAWADAQRDAGLADIADLCERAGLGAEGVLGHNEVPGAATACPGAHVSMDDVRRDVGRILEARKAAQLAEGPTLTKGQIDTAIAGCHAFAAVLTVLGEALGKNGVVAAGETVDALCDALDEIMTPEPNSSEAN